jgi:hypothetical protein
MIFVFTPLVLTLVILRFKSFEIYIIFAVFLIFGFPSFISLSYGINIQKMVAILFLIEVIILFLQDLKTNLRKIPLNVFFILLLVFLWLFSSFTSNSYPGVEQRAIAQTILFFGVFSYFNIKFRAGSLKLRQVSIGILAAFVLNFIFAIYEQYTGTPISKYLISIFGSDMEGWDFVTKEKFRFINYRSQGLMVHPLSYALLSVVGYISLIFMIRKSNKSKSHKMIFSTIGFVICLYSVFISGSRSGIGTFVIISLFLVASGNLNYKRIATLLIIMSISSIYLLITDFQVVNTIINIVAGTGQFSEISNSNAVRVQQYSEIFSALDKSFLIGHGVDSAIHFTEFGTVDNFWLTWLANYGVIGFIILVVFLLYKFNYGRKINSKDRFFYNALGITFLSFSPILSLSYLTLILILFLSIEQPNNSRI